MLWFAHYLLMAMYMAAPAAALAWGLRGRRVEGAARRRATMAVTSAAAVALGLGIGLNAAYAVLSGASVRIGQVIILTYWITALILMLRGLNRGLELLLRWLLRIRLTNEPSLSLVLRVTLASGVRTAVLISLGLSMVMASIMTFRPKVKSADDPMTLIGVPFQSVQFYSDDGVRLAGWWIPAQQFSDRTVLVCHGLGANKSNQFSLALPFLADGCNVLIFDFRAHGESGGQLSSFGDLERRDVLAAARWLGENRPAESRHLHGVGASMGAAALIAAAADASPAAQAFESIAVYGTYDNLGELTGDIAHQRFIWPIDQLVIHLALPLASVHAGTDLAAFSPVTLVDRIAPRPVLFIHGTSDLVIPFGRGEKLFNAASQPKYREWIEGGDHNAIINSPAIGKRVAEFFRNAKPVI